MVTERQLCFITKVSWYGLYRATICVFCGLFFVNHSLMLGLSKSSGLWKEAKIGVLFMREWDGLYRDTKNINKSWTGTFWELWKDKNCRSVWKCQTIRFSH